MPKAYAPEFRRKVLGLVASGRPVAQVAHDLEISEQAIYNWCRHQLVDSGQLPGLSSSDRAGLVAARKRIAELEAKLAIHRKAAEFLGDVVQFLSARLARLQAAADDAVTGPPAAGMPPCVPACASSTR